MMARRPGLSTILNTAISIAAYGVGVVSHTVKPCLGMLILAIVRKRWRTLRKPYYISAIPYKSFDEYSRRRIRRRWFF
jgi:hypothetical protein